MMWLILSASIKKLHNPVSKGIGMIFVFHLDHNLAEKKNRYVSGQSFFLHK